MTLQLQKRPSCIPFSSIPVRQTVVLGKERCPCLLNGESSTQDICEIDFKDPNITRVGEQHCQLWPLKEWHCPRQQLVANSLCLGTPVVALGTKCLSPIASVLGWRP